MNVYLIDAGEITTYDIYEHYRIPETTYVVMEVVAKTRGQAWSLMLRHLREVGFSLEWTHKKSIRKIDSNPFYRAGVR